MHSKKKLFVPAFLGSALTMSVLNPIFKLRIHAVETLQKESLYPHNNRYTYYLLACDLKTR